MTAYQIDFAPVGRRGQCPADESLLVCSRKCGLGIISICGGQGKCHCCKVQILSGTVSKPTSNDLEVFSSQELNDGWRLACQTYPTSDCTLRLPPESISTPQRTQVEGLEVALRPEPIVQTYHLNLEPPSLSDVSADADRVIKMLNLQHQLTCGKIDIDVLQDLSPKLRLWNWQCRASVRGDEIIALGPLEGRELGLAVDLGSTKVAGYLVDLNSGQSLIAKAAMNPQMSYGEDIITRITRVIQSPTERKRIQELTIECLNRLVADLCTDSGTATEGIVDAVVVGNTAMLHLLLRLPVEQLAHPPFVPVVSRALDIKARDVGLDIASGAYVHLLPSIAGFVGADHTAVLLATKADETRGVALAIDIGTNTEVSLIHDGETTSVSCASGPAFEGGHVRHGMRAARGAIERLRIEHDSVQYQTIDGVPPSGICGSGVLDAIAQMYLAGVLNEGGRMQDGHPLVRSNRKQYECVLVNEEECSGRSAIVITQKDVRALQTAKAAIRTGIQVLLETKGLTEEDIDEVVIAGAFGSYIDIASAVSIGMLPPLALERFSQVGNAAGMGAKLALISCSERRKAQNIAAEARYIELATAPNFMETFIEAIHLGLYRIKNGKREGAL